MSEPPHRTTFRLALGQMRIEPGDPEGNLARAADWVDRARRRGADVVLLPEAIDCGWTHPSAIGRAGPIPEGPSAQFMRELARSNRVWLAAGLVERQGNRLFNAAVLLDDTGVLRLHHRKIHEIEFARRLYALGDRLGVVETPFGRLGMAICADAFAPGLAVTRALGLMGARGILSPCAWAVKPDHNQALEPYGALWMDSYGPVAKEHRLWIAGCSNVGPVLEGDWRGWRCIGCSLVMGPDGAMARGPYGEDAESLIVVDLPRTES